MKQIFKIIMLSVLSLFGALLLLIGGMYLFGGFNEKIVYAKDIAFNSSEIISANTFSLQIDTNTSDVTRKTLKLETSIGGERIINFPQTVTIGKPFIIVPVRDANNKNTGGVVELYARYDDDKADQSVVAKCKILIDVPVESCDVIVENKELKITDNLLLATRNQNLTEVFSFSSIQSMLPYINKSLLTTSDENSIFSAKNFVDKKIFLSLINVSTGKTDSNFANFEYTSGGQTVVAPTIQVPYEYNADNNTFVFSSDIKICPKSSLGEVVLRVYACKTYNSQKDIVLSKLESYDLIKKDVGLYITNYTIDNISLDESDRNIYFDEQIKIFLNNENVTGNDINLNLRLLNNSGVTVEDFYYKNNVYISIVNDISDNLTKMDGSTSQTNEENIFFDSIQKDKSTWGWKYSYNDFKTYFTYKNAQTSDNKIKVKIEYKDNVSNIVKYFYLVPKAREVNSFSTVYEQGQEQIMVKSGEELRLNNNNFVFEYENGESATFENLAYYIPYIEGNNIVTIPDANGGNFKVKFYVTPTSGGKITGFNKDSDWCSLVGSNVIFRQDTNVYEIAFDASGESSSITTEDVIFDANKEIEIEIDRLSKTQTITSNSNLFSFSCGGEEIVVDAIDVKFYQIDAGVASALPMLSVNNVKFNVDFKVVDVSGIKNLYIIDSRDSTFVVKGIGTFTVVARLAYFAIDGVYLLGKESPVNIYVSEDLNSLSVYNFAGDKQEMIRKDALTVDEAQTNESYLFVTTNQIETLKRIRQSNQLKISAVQQFGAFNPDDYVGLVGVGLADINKNAITFGDWEEVFDASNNLIGYKISYLINEIFTIKIDDITIENKFDIKVYVDNNAGDLFYGTFQYNDSTSNKTLTFNIVDKLLTISEIKYADTSLGTKDNPLKMLASVVNGEMGWQLDYNKSGVNALAELKYGFKYSSTDTNYDTTFISRSIIEDDSNFVLNNITDFYTFATDETNPLGYLKFKNVPYKEGGILIRLKINSNTIIPLNSYYLWNGSNFVQTICEGVKNGAEFYFALQGFNISIQAQNVPVNGTKDTTANVLGTDNTCLFKITNAPEGLNYQHLFNCEATTGGSSQNSVSLSENYKTMTVTSDFLGDETIKFKFYYGSSSGVNVLRIKNSKDEYVESIDVVGQSAFTITPTLSFVAPSTNISFVNITYKNDNSNAIEKGKVSISSLVVSNDEQNVVIVNDDKTLSFKSMTGSTTAKIGLILIDNESNKEKPFDYNITITSKYTDNDITIGTEGEGGIYSIIAGVTQDIGSGITLAGELATNRQSISNIETTFTNEDSGDTLLASQHMRSQFTLSSSNSFKLFSLDLNYDKYVIIDLKFTFNDGGTFNVTKKILVIHNLEMSLNDLNEINTGRIINLGDANIYDFTKNGVKTSLSNEFANGTYSKESFDYDESIFQDMTNDETILRLVVSYLSDTSTEEEKTINTAIKFNYKVINGGYTLEFTFNISVTMVKKIQTN